MILLGFRRSKRLHSPGSSFASTQDFLYRFLLPKLFRRRFCGKIILTSTSLMLTNSNDERFQKRCRYVRMYTLSSFSYSSRIISNKSYYNLSNVCLFVCSPTPPRSLGRSSPNLEGRWRAAPDISLRGSFFERSRS